MMGMIAASVPFGPFTLTGQFFAGQNLGGIQACCGQTVYYHNFENGSVKGNAVRTIGGFVDLAYRLNDTWSFAVGYGCDDPVDSDVEGGYNLSSWPVPGVLYNDRVYINAFYQITANFKLGLEYARLMTSYADDLAPAVTGGDYDANRVQFTAFYNF